MEQEKKVRETLHTAKKRQENKVDTGPRHAMPADMQRDVLEHGVPPVDNAGQPMERQSVTEEVLGTDKQSEAPGMDEYDSREKHQTGQPKRGKE